MRPRVWRAHLHFMFARKHLLRWLTTPYRQPDPLPNSEESVQSNRTTSHIYWGPRIAGTRVATEAMYLFAVYVLETLGYRRFEWKCDALNTPSRRAAQRFGFTYEGHFRRARDHPQPQSGYRLLRDACRGVACAQSRL